MAQPLRYPIQVVARLTGLSPHVIRVWEKRYQVVIPARSGTNRRLYTDEQIERLRLLAQATAVGHKIGNLAHVDADDLQRMAAMVLPAASEDDGSPVLASSSPSNSPTKSKTLAAMGGRPRAASESVTAQLIAEAVEATSQFQTERLQRAMEQGAVRLGLNGVLRLLVCPLAQQLGELWRRGEITAAHEHFASAIIRDHLMRKARPFATEENAPCAIIATPTGQLHELGAVMVTAATANQGWRPIYLGVSLPPTEIAGAAVQNEARAVFLSIVYPADDRQLPRDLAQLRRLLPAPIELVVGGRAVPSYAQALKEIGAIIPTGLDDFCDLLDKLRHGQPRLTDSTSPPATSTA